MSVMKLFRRKFWKKEGLDPKKIEELWLKSLDANKKVKKFAEKYLNKKHAVAKVAFEYEWPHPETDFSDNSVGIEPAVIREWSREEEWVEKYALFLGALGNIVQMAEEETVQSKVDEDGFLNWNSIALSNPAPKGIFSFAADFRLIDGDLAETAKEIATEDMAWDFVKACFEDPKKAFELLSENIKETKERLEREATEQSIAKIGEILFGKGEKEWPKDPFIPAIKLFPFQVVRKSIFWWNKMFASKNLEKIVEKNGIKAAAAAIGLTALSHLNKNRILHAVTEKKMKDTAFVLAKNVLSNENVVKNKKAFSFIEEVVTTSANGVIPDETVAGMVSTFSDNIDAIAYAYGKIDMVGIHDIYGFKSASNRNYKEIGKSIASDIITAMNVTMYHEEERRKKGKKLKGKEISSILGLGEKEDEYEWIVPDNLDGLFAGYATDCCQVIGMAGSGCMLDGLSSPRGGFILVKKRGRIIAQSWIWVPKSCRKTLVVDSIEILRNGAPHDKIAAMYKKAFKKILEEGVFYRIVFNREYSDFTDLLAYKIMRDEDFTYEEEVSTECENHEGYTDISMNNVFAVQLA